jgi:hypothetical protein
MMKNIEVDDCIKITCALPGPSLPHVVIPMQSGQTQLLGSERESGNIESFQMDSLAQRMVREVLLKSCDVVRPREHPYVVT